MALAFPSILLFEVSAALMVMELAVGGNSGAVYIPFAAIVPMLAFPPAIPLIDQITAGFDPSPVFAVNCYCVTPGIDALGGVTVNAVSPGPPAAPGPLGRIAWAQPPSKTTNADSITSAERFTASPLIVTSNTYKHAGGTPQRHQGRRAFQTSARLVLGGYWG